MYAWLTLALPSERPVAVPGENGEAPVAQFTDESLATSVRGVVGNPHRKTSDWSRIYHMNPCDIPMYTVCYMSMYHLDQDALEDCRFRSKNQTFFRNHILPS